MKDLKKYKVVVEIAKSGSISKAAENFKISQPTLSKFLLNLENDLGFEIFDRTVIPIKTTELGEKFLNLCHLFLENYHQFEKEMQEIKSNEQNIIKIGVSPSRSPYLMPILVKEFLLNNPKCKVIIKEDNSNNLIKFLMSGELDLIISIANEDTKQFEAVKLFNEEILLAIHKKYLQNDFYSMIRNVPMITIGEGLGLWKLTNKFVLETKNNSPMIECQSLELGLSLVEEELGMLLVPNYFENSKKYSNTIYMSVPNLLKEKLGNTMERQVSIFYKKKQFLTNLEKRFIIMCKHYFENESKNI